MTTDITRAIRFPSYRSRAIATRSTPDPAAPSPHTNRNTSSAVIDGANVAPAAPSTYTTIPARRTGPRPKRSENGP